MNFHRGLLLPRAGWDAELGTLSEEERAVRTFAESHRAFARPFERNMELADFSPTAESFHEVLRGLGVVRACASTKKSTACCWGHHLSLFQIMGATCFDRSNSD